MKERKYNSILFKNDYKNNQKSPDFKGEIEIEGKKLNAAVWVRTARNNKKYLSLSIDENLTSKLKKTESKSEKELNKKRNKDEILKNIERLSQRNIKNYQHIKKINVNTSYNVDIINPKPVKKNRPSIFKQDRGLNPIPKSTSNLGVGTAGTKKTPPKYVRYIDEPLGTRSDFIKDKKRSGK